MKDSFNHTGIVFVRILLPFMLGIVAFYDHGSRNMIPCIGIACTALVCYLLSMNLLYIKCKVYRFKGITGLLFCVLFFCFGALCGLRHKQIFQPNHFSFRSSRYLMLQADSEPQVKGKILRFKARVLRSYSDDGPCSGTIMVAMRIDTINPLIINYGDELIIPGKFSDVKPPLEPYDFDYRAWLAAQNVYQQTFLKQQEVALIHHDRGNPVIAYALALRKRQVAYYRQLLKSDDAFAVASTLILGYRADLSKDVLASYSKTGTIHALSVSGMHVGLIYVVLNWLLFFLDRNKFLKAMKLLLILMLIWFYALLTGLSPAVLRSALMLSVFILSKSFARSTNSYNGIAFAAFWLLLYDPFLCFDVGFQLSFLAVLGLIYLQPKIENWWYIENRFLNKLWSITAMSLAAQLITFPLSIYYFHQFPVYFLLSNLFILLPITLLMYIGIIILVFRLDILAVVFEWLINFTNAGLKFITELPFATVSDIWISRTELALLCISLSFLVVAMSNFNKKLLFIGLLFLLALQSLLTYHKIVPEGTKIQKAARN